MIHNSQLRRDPVSGDWIVIAPGRAKRPYQLLVNVLKRKKIPKKGCAFEDPQKHGNKPILVYPDAHNWTLQIIENKYPAVIHRNICGVISKEGPFSVAPGIGHHDVIITRDHNKNFPNLSKEQAQSVFQAFRDRYLMVYNDKCVFYVSIFHNWGPTAGASVYHPHYQLIALPVVPPDVSHSLKGSADYYHEHKKCVHCVMIDWEKKEKKRVIFENDKAIAFAPFVSRNSFEVRIFPKRHSSYFENTSDEDMNAAVEALRFSLKSFEKNLKDPDYNFFLHTAPIKDKEKYRHYHWHIEAFPKVSIRAGFELGTGVEINNIDPDLAAKTLRKV